MLSNITALVSSPAQGAMYAPLALKFVYSKRAFSMSDSLFSRAPTHQINAFPLTTGALSKSKSSHIGAIAGGAVGGVAALLALGAIALVARGRRRRSRRRKSIGSMFERDVIDPDLPMTVTPFNPTFTGVAELETGHQMSRQERWTESGPESASLVHPSTPSDSPLPSSRVVPLPLGLHSKELAQLRADNSHSQSTDALSSGTLLSPATERSADTSYSETRRLQSEVEYLRLEMQQIRAERFEAPPVYEDGGA